jgi:hypothetical protein
VATNFEKLKFTFSSLVVTGCRSAAAEIQDSDFFSGKNIFTGIYLAKILPAHGTYTSSWSSQKISAP